MGQRSVVLRLARKGLSAIGIHHDLAATLGPEVASYSSMTREFREILLVSYDSLANIPEVEPQFDDSVQAVIALAEQPFASIRELAQPTHLPRTTVHKRLTQSLALRVRYLRWVSHLLSHSQKTDRVILSQ
jgi:hypothetical protein